MLKVLKVVFIMIALMGLQNGFAQTDQRAMRKKVMNGINETQTMKRAKKKISRMLASKFDLDNKALMVGSMMGLSAARGKVKSRDIKDVSTKFDSGVEFRPSVEYRLNGSASGALEFNYEF